MTASDGRGNAKITLVDKIKNLRRPVVAEINGHPVSLVTVGYAAHVLGRTSWTIKYWTKVGLFPRAPYVINPNDPRTRRHLYSEAFIDSLVVIANRGYLGRRLDRDQWQRFRNEVFTAFDVSMSGLTNVVTAKSDMDAVTHVRGQADSSLSYVE